MRRRSTVGGALEMFSLRTVTVTVSPIVLQSAIVPVSSQRREVQSNM